MSHLIVLALFMFFQYKMRYLEASKKKNPIKERKIIHYSCEDGLEQSSLVNTVCHPSASLVMPIGDPRDGVFYPSLALMMDSYFMEIQFINSKESIVCFLLLINSKYNQTLWKTWDIELILSGHSKEDQRLVFKTDYRLTQFKSIAECSNTFDLH